MDETARHAGTCRYYWNRAWSRPRDHDVAFVTMMAEACRTALERLSGGSAAERTVSLGFLRRLTEFRALIVGMSSDKYRRARAPGAPRAAAMQRYEISEAGEVLIARCFGVMDAFDAWLARTPGFTLAAR